MEDSKNNIFTGTELISTTNGIPGVMVAGCIVPVDPKKPEYMIYSPYANQDYVTIMEFAGDRKNGPTLHLRFKNIKNRNFYVFLMQCTPFLGTGNIDNAHYLACSYYAFVSGEVDIYYDFYMYNTYSAPVVLGDSYYSFFLPCIE